MTQKMIDNLEIVPDSNNKETTSQKTHKDAEKEYGYKLSRKLGPAEVNASTLPYDYFLEDENGNRTKITSNEALEFIANAKMGNHDGQIPTYDNYVNLFNILGIKPKIFL